VQAFEHFVEVRIMGILFLDLALCHTRQLINVGIEQCHFTPELFRLLILSHSSSSLKNVACAVPPGSAVSSVLIASDFAPPRQRVPPGYRSKAGLGRRAWRRQTQPGDTSPPNAERNPASPRARERLARENRATG